jgi:hypothetical protein
MDIFKGFKQFRDIQKVASKDKMKNIKSVLRCLEWWLIYIKYRALAKSFVLLNVGMY